jgi:Tol biopolymer transport system component
MMAVRAVLLIALSACGRVGFDAGDAGDATLLDVSADAPRTCGPFAAPVQLPGPVNQLSDDEWAPAVSADELSLYFYCFRSGGPGAPDLWHATRASRTDLFSPPTPLSEVSSTARESSPSVTGDDLLIAFASDVGGGMEDLYLASRASRADSFGAPVKNDELSSALDDGSPELSADGLEVMFQSNRGSSTDLYLASRPDRSSPFSNVILLPGINTLGAERTPTWSTDELELFFVSDRPGGVGQLDLWHATRATREEPFGGVENLAILNSTGDEYAPTLSVDGTHLYYSYNAPYSGGGSTAQIWVATRTCQ